jgi:hypothetical protein
MSLFEEDLAKVKWATRKPGLQLGSYGYSLIAAFLICRPEQIKFRLKDQNIMVTNDGAIILRHQNQTRSYRANKVNGERLYLKTIVSVEV